MEQKKRGNMFLFSVFSDILIKNGNEVRASLKTKPLVTNNKTVNRDIYDL
jgi:hypothetical protein